MKEVKKFYDNTVALPAHEEIRNIKEYLDIKGTAIDLGCGAGRDTKELLKNGWKVIAVDVENTKQYIENELTEEEKNNFRFIEGKFEDISFEKNDLTIAYFSLQYCEKTKFKEVWNRLEDSINENGLFIGTFLGNNDSWKNLDKPILFFDKEEVQELFKDFELIKFKEVEKDGKTGLGIMKHWHIFEIVAKKKG